MVFQGQWWAPPDQVPLGSPSAVLGSSDLFSLCLFPTSSLSHGAVLFHSERFFQLYETGWPLFHTELPFKLVWSGPGVQIWGEVYVLLLLGLRS